jgi:uncharacterized protein (DUF1015 family)
MPEFKPFQGLCYNSEIIDELAEVVTPPYDVISPAQQDDYYACHPKNVIRLILNRKTDTDSDNDNRHSRAAECFLDWKTDRVLCRDGGPAYYLTAVDFQVNGHTTTRYGIIGLIRLEPFENGTILPHEKTFSKVRSERLKLLKATEANFCPIFSVFSDSDGVIQKVIPEAASAPAVSHFADHQGLVHRMWRITDPGLQERIRGAIEHTTVFIADGHHRYETALNYRAWLQETDPSFDDNHPGNYVMMYLCSLEDPGLTILPAHRLLKKVPPESIAAFLKRAPQYFRMERLPFTPDTASAVRDELIARIEAHPGDHTFGVCIRGHGVFYRLWPKPGIMKEMFGKELAPELLDLDVTVITRLAFMELLGFDQQRLDDETRIDYRSVSADAVDAALKGECDMAFVINPTRMEQVQAVSSRGLIMPRKSTYFYPKAITGQVLYDLKMK